MKDLTGKGKPFHSALDKAAALLKRKVGTGAEFMKELQGLGGIKQAEIDERKLGEILGMPRMTHDQFMANLAMRPVPAIGEKVFGGDPDDPNWIGPYHYTYTLPGGENYREMLIKAPKGVDNQEKIMELEAKIRRIPMIDSTPEQQEEIARYQNQITKLRAEEAASPKQFQGVGHHFGGEKGILASMRVKDRTGPNGEKLLHLEELQSDWHQQGREKGYISQDIEKQLEAGKERMAKRGEQIRQLTNQITPETPLEEFSRLSDEIQRLRELQAQDTDWGNNLIDTKQYGVPDAPFKKNWEEMALKRLVHHAAEKGYHGIVVTPGAEQADRYSLATHIGGVDYIRNEEKPHRNEMIAYDPKGNVVFNQYGMTPDKLEEYIGKEAAQKLLAQEAQPNKSGLPTHSLRGEQLQMGGEGMKGFYDKKVPNILNAIGKKHGVKTKLHGHTIYGRGRERTEEEFRQATQNVPFERHKEFDYEPKPIQLHHFPITEEMRKDILTNGLPLYQEGGIIRKAQGGNVQLTVEQMRQQLMAAGKPLSDISQVGVQEAPNLPVKGFVIPHNGATGSLPMGGIDMEPQQPGQQMLPANMMQPQPNPLMPQPPQAPAGAPQGGSNILQMTPQGQKMAALSGSPQGNLPPPKMAVGGGVPMPVNNHPFQTAGEKPMPFIAKEAGVDNRPMNNDYSDNGATDFTIDNIQQLAIGGYVQGMNEGQQPKPTAEQRKEIAKKWAGQLHYEPAPAMSKQDIERHADRMVAQILGIDNPHGKTKQQLEREKSLIADIRYKKMKNIPDVDYSKLKNAWLVGIPGDPTIGGVIPVNKMKKRFSLQMPTAGATLRAIDNQPLETPVPLYGGTRYGAYGGPNAWASDLGASRGLFNVVQKLHEEDPSRDIYGNTHRMSNESANHAIHMLDSAISHMRPHMQPKDRVDYLNDLIRNVRTSTNDIGDVKPHFVGFENPNDLMLQASMDAKLRKKILAVLATNKHFPGGKQMIDDIYFAISHPELRNVEVGTAGHGVVKFDPTRKLENEISQHPTYAHDIPSELIGKSRYPIPLQIAAPRSMQRSLKKAKEMGLTLAQPFNDMSRSIIREPIDQQYINQLGEYELAMKKRLGYKKGGKVKLSTNMDTINLELSKSRKKAK